MNGNDGQYRIFLNTKGQSLDVDEQLQGLFDYINGGIGAIGTVEQENSLAGIMDRYVSSINEDELWKGERMKYECDMSASFHKGERQGFSQGQTEATARIVKEMVRDGLSNEKIAQYTSISVEQVRSILQG